MHFRLSMWNVESGDAGEYSCEMTEKDVDIDKTREFVSVSVS